MLGMFVSSLPIRITVDPDTDFLSFVRTIGREQLSVMRHQRFPYNLLVNELRNEQKDLHNLIGISMQYQPLQWHNADDFDYETALYFSGFAKDRLFWTQTFEHPLEYHSLADQTSLQKQSTSASRDTIIRFG